MVRPRTQRALTDSELARHLPVMLNFGVSLIEVVVEDEFLFIAGQLLQTLRETLRRVAAQFFRCGTLRQDVGRNFSDAARFENQVASDAVKVAGRVADVAGLDFGQPLNDTIDSFVRIVFRVTETLRDEDADQPGTDQLVPFTCFVAIRIEPLK